jgi:hypothetical protein
MLKKNDVSFRRIYWTKHLFIYLLVALEFELRAARQVLYHLSHSANLEKIFMMFHISHQN